MQLDRFTIKSQEALQAAIRLAADRRNTEAAPQHLLLALLDQQDGIVGRVLRKVGADPAAVRSDVGGELDREYISTEHLLLALADAVDGLPAQADIAKAIEQVRGPHRVTDQSPEEKYQSLERFGRDLTQAADEGKLDPVIGRDDEIRRIIQVLSRRTKNNPVLIGEPGVGKTAIVEGLAQRI